MALYTWFECKIRYEKLMENGKNKKVTEPYLVDALSFTEAEARIIEEMTPYITGEFTVSDIKRANYSELFTSDEDSADRWFKAKLIFITLDEKSGAEKKSSTYVLVQAADLRDAIKKLDEGMKGTMADYQIGMVSETPLMDVYPYEATETPEFSEDGAPDLRTREETVSQLIQKIPNGTVQEVQIGSDKVIIDRTGKDTKVNKLTNHDNEARRNDSSTEAEQEDTEETDG